MDQICIVIEGGQAYLDHPMIYTLWFVLSFFSNLYIVLIPP